MEIPKQFTTPSTDCDNVLVPKVNDEIWSKHPANAQTLELQHYETKSVEVSSAIMCTTDKLLEHVYRKRKNGCEVTYEMFHILKCGFEIK